MWYLLDIRRKKCEILLNSCLINTASPYTQTAWRNALSRAGIENFRWHDLRHTWASWHVQNGTSLQELQVLGGWASLEMVLRYAHLSGDHLKAAADRVPATFLLQSTWFEAAKTV